MSFKLYLFLIAMTFLRPVDLLFPDLAIYRPMLVLLLVVLVTSFMAALKANKVTLAGPQSLILSAFFGVIFISATLHVSASAGLATLMDFGPIFLLFLLSVWNLTTLERLRSAILVLVGCLIALTLLSLYAYHTGFMADVLVYKEGGYGDMLPASADLGETSSIPAQDQSKGYLWRLRSFGFLGDPNDFGQALVLGLPLLWGFYQQQRFWRHVMWLGVPAGLMTYAIYLTHSRGALLGLVTLAFFAIKRRLGAVLTGLLVGGGLVSAMALGFTGGRAYTANEESAGGRIDAWRAGLDMLREYPLVGVGYGQFQEHHTLHTAHNSFVLCFAETGLVGYFLWLGLIVLVFKQLNRTIQVTAGDQAQAYQRWALAIRSALIGFLTCALFLSRSYHPPLYLLLAMGIGIAYCAQQEVKQAAQPLAVRFKWRTQTILLELASLVLIYMLVA